jgi:ferrochelatase
MSAEKTAVLLLAHGSPESPADIPEFLLSITGGRALPEHVVKEVQHRYALIGRSPLTEITLKQGEDLARALGMPVYVGMRNWRPFIAEVVQQMAADGVTRAIAIPMAPQNSQTSVGQYRKVLEAAQPPFAVDYVEEWHDHPLLIQAFAERVRAGLERAPGEPAIIFTAHSVPERTVQEGDPYERQAKETAALVARAAGLREDQWSFAFQSQGMSGGTWLGPTVEETIRAAHARGARSVYIAPIGFVCDHVEILYDIDIGFSEFAKELGMTVSRPESLNDSPALIAALADLARARIGSPSTEAVPQRG